MFTANRTRRPPARLLRGTAQAIHFVARAASLPFWSKGIAVNAKSQVSRFQWWIELTPLVAITPVSYRYLCEVAGEQINLKGRSGKYIPPDVANALVRHTEPLISPAAVSARDILRPVVGRPDLPNPPNMTIDDLRGMPSSLLGAGKSPFRVEREVERFVVEPLLRLCDLSRHGATWQRQYPVGRRKADYVVLVRGAPKSVIEVKQRVKGQGSRGAKAQSDYNQLSHYAAKLGCRGALVDCDEIFLFSGEPLRLRHRFQRRCLTSRQLGQIAAHLVVRRDDTTEDPEQAATALPQSG